MSRKKKSSQPWEYVGEFNRCRGDNIRKCGRRLSKKGIQVTFPPHKTAIKITRPESMSFAQFAGIVRAEVQPRIGSLLLMSKRTGNVFICNNHGNRPNRLLRV